MDEGGSEVKQPDPYLHKMISFWKSGLRILAGTALCAAGWGGILTIAGILIISAEILGILEEMV